jgi:4-hydroxybenzoate polyprenyltransferase
MLFFPGWNTLLAGYLNGIDDVHPVSELFDGTFNFHFWNFELLLVIIAFMLAMGGSFILNQIADVETDRKNRKLFLIDENFLSKNAALGESIILILGSLGLGYLVNFNIFALIFLFLMITAYLYNFRPFQYKNKPFSGLLLNILMGWIAFAMGWFVSRDFSFTFIVASLPYVLLNTGLYLLTTLPDMSGDRLASKRTFSVIFGLSKTIITAGLLYLASLILSIVVSDQIILIINGLLLIYFLKMIIDRDLPAAIIFIKMAIFFFSIVICIKFPLYFPVMVFIFLLSKFYYRRRFRFDYPNFRGT